LPPPLASHWLRLLPLTDEDGANFLLSVQCIALDWTEYKITRLHVTKINLYMNTLNIIFAFLNDTALQSWYNKIYTQGDPLHGRSQGHVTVVNLQHFNFLRIC